MRSNMKTSQISSPDPPSCSVPGCLVHDRVSSLHLSSTTTATPSSSPVGGVAPLCVRCHLPFDPRCSIEGTSTACRFHPCRYVCRYHPEGHKYYAAVEDIPSHKGWEAKFWY
eukprot:GHVT01099826.1.p1 GENE.GHVT01099826.1~~GHVT01099826.1.p1  ORF type:complete len:112 (+),score=14.32 GHVT01099826.1:137-472(+)